MKEVTVGIDIVELLLSLDSLQGMAKLFMMGSLQQLDTRILPPILKPLLIK